MRIVSTTVVAVALFGLTLAFGCGGRAFAPTLQKEQAADPSEVIGALQKIPARKERAVVVGVSGQPTGIFAWDLGEGKMLWTKSAEALSAPLVAGDLVIAQEKDGVVARDLTSGEKVFELSEKGRLVGADSDGEYTVISVSVGLDSDPRGILIMAKGGSVLWSRDLKMPVGWPTVSKGMAIVPWATTRISMLDAKSGEEKARFELKDDIVGHAFVDRGSVYVGQHAIRRVAAGIETGEKKEELFYQPKGRPLPAQPPLLRDGYEPAPEPENAWHRVRLVWRPSLKDGKTISLEDQNLYLLFYRFLFALDPDKDEIRWVYQHPVDMVGASAIPGGAMLVDENGEVFFVSAKTGQKRWEVETGTKAVAAGIRVGAFEPKTDGDGAATALDNQLFAAARMSDSRLAGGRALAVRYLARFEGAEITGKLVEICSDRSSPEPVRLAGCGALAERTSGEQHVRAGLQKRASFLKGEQPPPVGALARAAARL